MDMMGPVDAHFGSVTCSARLTELCRILAKFFVLMLLARIFQ